jgi:hypothetical protein
MAKLAAHVNHNPSRLLFCEARIEFPAASG